MRSYLASDDDQQDSNFRASEVRIKLEEAGQPELMQRFPYMQSSRKFAHFRTGSIFLNTSVYEIDVLGLDTHRRVMNQTLLVWASFIHAAMRLGLELVGYNDDESLCKFSDEGQAAIDRVYPRIFGTG